MMDHNTSDVLDEFLSECGELLERISSSLIILEKAEKADDTLASIRRDMHTIKGSAQLFGFKQTARIAHAAENCLERLKGCHPDLLSNLVDGLYKALDAISQLLGSIKSSRAEPPANEDFSAAWELLERLESSGTVSQQSQHSGDAERTNLSQQAKSSAASANPPRIAPSETKPTSEARSDADTGQSDSIRVHVELLDNLMNLVGELVLIRNQLEQATRLDANEALQRISQSLNVVTGELQNDIMKTRMQPIGNVLNKFQRVVRDLSRELGKKIDLELNGAETELDKTLIEAVRDPLMHLVRNAIDHGLETPADRHATGKADTGRLAVSALHESGQVVVRIADDGRGLSRAKIAKKAIDSGLATPEQVERLSDRDVQQFIFLPGFSTAERVSDLSGRGVGMDVVKTNIEKIGGTIELSSVAGKGTEVTLRIPLTLAIISALIVRVGEEKFGIPQVKLLELLQVEPEGTPGGIERLQNRAVFRLRGKLLPLVDLAEVLGIGGGARAGGSSVHNIAVVSDERNTFGLIVDAIEDSVDVVVKPLASFLKDLGAYTGATIMGDGSVVLSLDVTGLAGRAGLGDGGTDRSATDAGPQGPERAEAQVNEALEYLLVEICREQYALPMCVVHRLEEIDVSELHESRGQILVRHRGSLIPVIEVSERLGIDPQEARPPMEKASLVLVMKTERIFGLLVDKIVDIVISESPLDLKLGRQGVMGAFIEAENVYMVIDALSMIGEMQLQDGGPAATKLSAGGSATAPVSASRDRVLLAEDSSFFRKHISQVLDDAGFIVRVAVNGEQALEILRDAQGEDFDAIVSDIEMPRLGGLDLARSVRGLTHLKGIPMLALSSRFTPADVERGIAAGFDEYYEKLTSDSLVSGLRSLIKSKGRKGAA